MCKTAVVLFKLVDCRLVNDRESMHWSRTPYQLISVGSSFFLQMDVLLRALLWYSNNQITCQCTLIRPAWKISHFSKILEAGQYQWNSVLTWVTIPCKGKRKIKVKIMSELFFCAPDTIFSPNGFLWLWPLLGWVQFPKYGSLLSCRVPLQAID